MRLYKDAELLKQTISATANGLRVEPSIVEKDYYLTVFLEYLSTQLPTLLFKGGTSLFKCYKIINRFSEDLDITLMQETLTQGQRKQVKQVIKAACNDLGLELLNEADTRSRRDYNRYEIDYSPKQPAVSIKPVLLVETTYIVKSYPAEMKSIAPMIYDYMVSIGQQKFVKDYELEPFSIRVQTLERTLIDKIFALCDYYLTENIYEHSRHIYDIYRLADCVKLNENFKSLFQQVRKDRQKGNSQCISADEKYSITALLTEILDRGIYKKDYIEITAKILFDDTSYDQAIMGLQVLIDCGLLG